MNTGGARSVSIKLFNIIAMLGILLLLFTAVPGWAQDSPGRFEVGGNLSALRFGGGAFGPGVDGDINFGRHIALDGSFSWLPSNPTHIVTGLFGAKVGSRTEHFGFFGKVRPGFVSLGDQLRDQTIIFGPGPGIISQPRFARQTERALDFGGVIEYYPARHWALRWDAGDTVVFQEQGPVFTVIGIPFVPSPTVPARTTHNFQFSTGVHYRF